MTDEPKYGVTIDFTIKGADPNNKLEPDERCSICDQLYTDHSREELFKCAHVSRDRRFPHLKGRLTPKGVE